MTIRRVAVALIFTAPFSSLAVGQDVGTEVQRNVN